MKSFDFNSTECSDPLGVELKGEASTSAVPALGLEKVVASCHCGLNPELEMNEEIHNRALLLIEDMCYLMCGSLLVRLGMPAPNREMNDTFNSELKREREYDHHKLDLVVQTNVPLLNTQQHMVVYISWMPCCDPGSVHIVKVYFDIYFYE
ncbi:hypothetical protein LAZ67_3003054 [Cordylochernes scorpioides]|uniref:Uncharacterized protein n=1 Tax=Cordylochernes scorpioides TaxID=51811 RepID=A0ABY6K9N7_9ARAC|nr:hypothetical protein LAZ67_3003054 [Cordylochernes scorpioides]